MENLGCLLTKLEKDLLAQKSQMMQYKLAKV